MRGYTLIEVLTVIVLLTIISLITLPTLLNTLQSVEQSRYQEFVSTIKFASETYIESNVEVYNLNEPEDEVIITISDLVKAGLYNEKTKNPKTGEVVGLQEQIKIVVQEDYTKQYIYPYPED